MSIYPKQKETTADINNRIDIAAKKREEQIELLFEIMDTEHAIRCTNCGDISKKYNCSEEYASEQFFKDGWRGKIHDYTYCPKCAEINGA